MLLLDYMCDLLSMMWHLYFFPWIFMRYCDGFGLHHLTRAQFGYTPLREHCGPHNRTPKRDDRDILEDTP